MAKIGRVTDFDPQSQAVGPSAALPMSTRQSPANPVGNSQRTPQAAILRKGPASSGMIKTKPGS